MSIEQLTINGFKSIDELAFDGLESFSVFAGANGAGKSNLFDAMRFASIVVDRGGIEAIRQFGGYSHIHCYRKRGKGARQFRFSVTVRLGGVVWQYDLLLDKLDLDPTVTESIKRDGAPLFERKDGANPRFGNEERGSEFPNYPKDRSALMFATPDLFEWLSNVRVFRIDPIGAKEPDMVSVDDSQLTESGNNVASVLSRLEADPTFSAQIMDWMALVAPGFERVSTEKERLAGRRVLTFKEAGTKNFFPANLVSDGTIYILCILTALLSRSKGRGVTLIEEPERGINPKAIEQMVELMRDVSSEEHPVFVSTHNETLVRSSKKEELLFALKDDGRTRIRYGRDAGETLGAMPLDKAWLSNLFGAGLPW